MIKEIKLQTLAEGLISVTGKVRETVAESGISDGLCVVYCPHTTAGVTINENCDPYVAADILAGLAKAFPRLTEYKHDEGNSAAHLKASAVGSSVTLLVEDGAPLLGVWQDIYFCEFDGPRTRTVYIKVIGQ